MKRIFSLLLALLLVFLSSVAMAQSAVTLSDEADADFVKAIAEKKSGTKIQRITDEPVTLTIWMDGGNGAMGVLIDKMEDMDVFKIMAEKTGVDVKITAASMGQADTGFSLMLASRNYPDIIFGFDAFYSGSTDTAVDEGIILDLTELTKQYAPNYEAKRTENEERAKSTVTDAGYQPSICSFNYEGTNGITCGGPIIRQDLLDKLGLPMPVTYDDWFVFLERCNSELGMKRTFGLGPNGMNKYNAFQSGYGFGMINATVFDPFYQLDGVVKYAPLTPEYKEYVEMMRTWYEVGVVDPDFVSTLTFDDGVALLSSGECAAAADHSAILDFINSLGKQVDPDFNFVAAPHPVKEAGDQVHIHNPSGSPIGKILSISSACQKPEIALQYLDQFYTDEAFMLLNYGTEGKTYEMVDGMPMYTELVVDNPSCTIVDVLTAYAAPVSFIGEFVSGRDASASMYSNAAVWDSNTDNAYEMPRLISLTQAEQDTYADVFPEVQSYVEEMTVKYIMGLESMDTYDQFVKSIYSLRIDEAVAAYQAALDRYNSR